MALSSLAKPAVFLDRDGVINPLIYHRDHGIVDSPFTLSQFTLMPKVAQAIRLLNGLDLTVVVVSNQPGIAKRHFTPPMLRRFDRRLQSALKRHGAHIDAIYYCVHHPDAVVRKYRKVCSCRKPRPGMLKQAARDLNLSLPASFMVGDGLTDIEAGHRAGCRTIFVGRWKCEHCQFIHPSSLRPTFVAKDLWEAAQLIRAELSSRSKPFDALKTARPKLRRSAQPQPCTSILQAKSAIAGALQP
jgi:D-glycero-D-manno-heptose 1,7-bisphosphate phosphatase